MTLNYHLVLRVEKDSPLITNEWRSRFFKYLVGCVRAADGRAEAIGGTLDRVHLLVGLTTEHQLADFVRNIKLISSVWVKRQMNKPDFAWQKENEAFTVSLSQCRKVRSYIIRQKEHHNQFGTGEEYASSWQRNAVETALLN
jgi:REP element-mobilizing transposase RayT